MLQNEVLSEGSNPDRFKMRFTEASTKALTRVAHFCRMQHITRIAVVLHDAFEQIFDLRDHTSFGLIPMRAYDSIPAIYSYCLVF